MRMLPVPSVSSARQSVSASVAEIWKPIEERPFLKSSEDTQAVAVCIPRLQEAEHGGVVDRGRGHGLFYCEFS